MNFASDYVYYYEEAEFEYVSDDELKHGIDVSDSDSDEESGKGKPKSKAGYKWKSADVIAAGDHNHKGKKVRRADTNIISIKFEELISPSYMHTGDAVCCTSCGAIVSNISNVTLEGSDKTWECEFCYEKNIVDVDPEEIPKVGDVTFMLEPAIAKSAESKELNQDDSLVVFCVDISGSMAQTTQVPGKISLRGTDSKTHGYDERRNMTQVSRLQAVQAAVDHQLEEMNREFPNRRVALITFESQVVVIGDGQDRPIIIDRNLDNKQALMEIGKDLRLPRPIKESRSALGQKVFGLRSSNMTALGPALVVSIAMAGAHAGSKVIICTDGQANVGIGKFNNSTSDEQSEGVQSVYEELGNTAVEMGVVVSVISLTGTDCKLMQLGMVADMTGGQVNIVDPMKLTEEFSTVLADQTIATNVVATCILHRELYFLYEECQESKIRKSVGNVDFTTEITFEYGIKEALRKKPTKADEPLKEKKDDKSKTKSEDHTDPQKEAEKMENVKSKEPSEDKKDEGAAAYAASRKRPRPSELPFQVQIQYTDRDGNKALRVFTDKKPLTKDRSKAEEKMNLKVLGKHAAYIGGRLAQEGEYTDSRCHNMMVQRLAHRHVNKAVSTTIEKQLYKKNFMKIKSLENQLLHAQEHEMAVRGKTHSDSEEDVEEEQLFGKLMGKKKKKMIMRSKETTDVTSKTIYQAKSSRFLDNDSD